MQESSTSVSPLQAWPKRFGRHLLGVGENRLELFVLELEQERRHFLEVSLLTLGAAVLALLAGMGITAAVVVLLWHTYPVAVLLLLGICYAVGAFFLYQRLTIVQRDWKAFSATLDQLQKDGACLKEMLT